MSAYLAPNWVDRKLLNPLAKSLGIASTLAIRTRRTGRVQTLPVNVFDHDGREYLVSVRGESQWVLNLRAAGACELRRRGVTRTLSVHEVPPAERAPIVEAYRRRWAAQVSRFFRQLPDPADHPVFVLREA